MDLGKLSELSERRECLVCGAVFRTIEEKGERVVTALEQYADHSTVHQPSPAEWTEAYNRIQEWKQKSGKDRSTQ